MAVVPAVAAYVLGVCFSLDLSVIRDTWRLLPASILYGLVIVVSAGTLMLALSSLSRRSLYVGIAWVGLWIISSAVAGVLDGIQREALFHTIWQEEMARGNLDQNDLPLDPDEPPSERSRRNRGVSGEAWQRVQQRVEQAEAEAAPTNWRPLCSYTANLQRLGEALLNTDAAWVRDRPGHRSAAGRAETVLGTRRIERGVGPDQQSPPRRPARAAVSVDLVGRRPGRPVGTFTMDSEHAREIAGPAEVTPVVEFDGVSKWYGNVIGLNNLTRADSARRHRAAWVPTGPASPRCCNWPPGNSGPARGACASSGTGPGTTRP